MVPRDNSNSLGGQPLKTGSEVYGRPVSTRFIELTDMAPPDAMASLLIGYGFVLVGGVPVSSSESNNKRKTILGTAGWGRGRWL